MKNFDNLPAIFTGAVPISPLARRYAICSLELALRRSVADGGAQEQDFPVLHQFSGTVYRRSMFLKAGSVLVGKLHRHAHPNFLWSGRALVFTEHEGLQLLVGPCAMISPAATKRALFILEDCIWTVEHPDVATRDLAEAEAQVIATSYRQLQIEDPFEQLLQLSTSQGA